uniref:Secreted protein n=1 Tax=Peronospora matthiolae TaxID=2874970 RepID=A0AAV1U8R9_9STRA
MGDLWFLAVLLNMCAAQPYVLVTQCVAPLSREGCKPQKDPSTDEYLALVLHQSVASGRTTRLRTHVWRSFIFP